ncbi:Anaphase-promoting complex subunit 5 [Morella rubra]|uniref:Anaphase-promoting complex subunit 5 n=1 Tax=Morella rubra TaxID=262757 RepID=A0A6A1WSR7_9ROSI|nr:Anaphase-promoting complex subunit 5 [Morella rubra]
MSWAFHWQFLVPVECGLSFWWLSAVSGGYGELIGSFCLARASRCVLHISLGGSGCASLVPHGCASLLVGLVLWLRVLTEAVRVSQQGMMPLHHLAPTLGGGGTLLEVAEEGGDLLPSLLRFLGGAEGEDPLPPLVLAHGVAEEGRSYSPCLACGIAEGRFALFSLLGVVDQVRIRTFPGHPRPEEDRSRFTLNWTIVRLWGLLDFVLRPSQALASSCIIFLMVVHLGLSFCGATQGRLVKQQSNDTCLAFTLAAICNMLSEIGVSSTAGILGSPFLPLNNTSTSISVQQQLFVLLRGSLKRAESLKLKRVVSSNHLAQAKFEMTHVHRPLLSFGPKASMKLRTCPINVCKELRLSSRLMSEFGSESCTMTTDGAFSAAWLKNLQMSLGSAIFSQESGSGSSTNALQFYAQQSSIPGSVLEFIGSSCLLRATAWEIYGSAPLGRINALVYATCFTDASSSSDAALAYVKLIQHLAAFKGYKGLVVTVTEI